MFRASDVFGARKAGATLGAGGQPKIPATQKRLISGAPPPGASKSSKTWDPSTGKYIDEDLPDEVQEMMGLKKARTDQHPGADATTPLQSDKKAWGTPEKPRGKVLGPTAVGLAVKPQGRGGRAAVDSSGPSVEYRGFSKVELNDRYYERSSMPVNGRPTYWGADGLYFLYWQGQVDRWSICDAASFAGVRAGQLPGWAYQEDHKHLCQASGWMEAWNGEWRAPELEVTFRSSSHHRPQWQDPAVQKFITTVEFHGFSMAELNVRYHLRSNELIQGRPSYWDKSGVYFIYWQQQMKRWAICDLKCMEAIRSGKSPGWAYRADPGHFANASGWCEMRGEKWVDANLETAVVGASAKGLKVEFHAFSKADLNTQYVERADQPIQGKASYWDQSETYFLYWQSSMKRWAICDNASLELAKSGLTPGWAFKKDMQHFTKAGSWMESWGREWRNAAATCTVLEGAVRGDDVLVKAEMREDEGDAGAREAGDAAEAAAAAKPDDGGDAELAHLEHAEVPQLSAMDYSTLVQSIYILYNVKKLQDMGRLLLKYRGKERELYLDVCTKYSVHPAKFHARHLKEMEKIGGGAIAAPV